MPPIEEKSAPRILVVDDDSNIRRFLVQILQRESYEIAEAASGETALHKLAEQSFDLVISDLHMDAIGGLEVLEAAKKVNKHTQVLIFTGFGSIRSAVDAIKKGAFDYFSKPVQTESLLFKVRKALERRELGQQLEEQQTRLDQYYRLLSRDLALAKRVQASLVPESFSAHGVAATVRYRPMIGLGGDFADIASNTDGRVYFTVIDVTGHGVSAALLVNRVCSEGRKLMRENLQPAQILQKLNRFFYDSFSQTGLFLTALTACIDTARQTLSYAGSAHPPALLWRKQNGRLQELVSHNMIIGFDAELTHPQQAEVPIHPGDRLLIYTDGAIEAENGQKKPLGIVGLKKNLLRFANLPLEDFADRMIETVKSFSGEKLRDDVLLLAAELESQ